MLIRIAVAACLLAGAGSPAWAVDYCMTSVTRDGREALVDGLVDGVALQAVRIEDDPIAGRVTLWASTVGYTMTGGGAAALTPYRTGQSVDGKDWRTPGSVATTFGGMALRWPRFYKGGAPVRDTRIVFEANGLSQGITSTRLPSDPDVMTLYAGWGSGPPMPSPHDYRSQYVSGDWSSVAVPGGQLVVKFYDGNQSTLLGSVAFAWPDEAPWTARMATQVNALRALSAAKKCVDAATLEGDPDDDPDDGDEEF